MVITGEKVDLPFDGVKEAIGSYLDEIQLALFTKAKAGRDNKLVEVLKWDDFVPALEKGCMVLTPFCDEAEWEDKVKVLKVRISSR